MDALPSPSKRRALAPRDANARPALSAQGGKPLALTRQTSFPRDAAVVRATSPLKVMHRRDDEDTDADAGDASPAAKKPRLGKNAAQEASGRSRSASPDASSVFDADATGDASWATAASEPDAETAATAAAAAATTANIWPQSRRAEETAAPGQMTRKQARESAEILRLRLGLASYKVRTGQTEMSLSELEAASRATAALRRISWPTASMLGATSSRAGMLPTNTYDRTLPVNKATSGEAGNDNVISRQAEDNSKGQDDDSTDATQSEDETLSEERDTCPALPALGIVQTSSSSSSSSSSSGDVSRSQQPRPASENGPTGGTLPRGAVNGLLNLARGPEAPQ